MKGRSLHLLIFSLTWDVLKYPSDFADKQAKGGLVGLAPSGVLTHSIAPIPRETLMFLILFCLSLGFLVLFPIVAFVSVVPGKFSPRAVGYVRMLFASWVLGLVISTKMAWPSLSQQHPLDIYYWSLVWADFLIGSVGGLTLGGLFAAGAATYYAFKPKPPKENWSSAALSAALSAHQKV